MNNLFSLLRLHTLAVLAFATAFFFWKDYLSHPHQKVEKGKLAFITGTYSQAGSTMSLPSGTSTGYYIIIKEANTSFIPVGFKFSEFIDEVPEGSTITLSYAPQENPMVSNEGIEVFSVKHHNKEYISNAGDVEWYNKKIDKKRNTAIYATLAGFLAIGLVELIRRKFLK